MNEVRLTEDQILKLVADEYGLKVSDIKGNVRKRPMPEARNVVVHLMTEMGYEQKDIAEAVNFNRSNIQGCLRRLDDDLTFYRDTQEHFARISNEVSRLLDAFKTELNPFKNECETDAK